MKPYKIVYNNLNLSDDSLSKKYNEVDADMLQGSILSTQTIEKWINNYPISQHGELNNQFQIFNSCKTIK